MKKKLTPLPKTVKEFVDFIYEYLIEHPEGLSFSMKTLTESRTQKRIASILVQRGIIERTSIPNIGKPGHSYRYKWVANMAPTKTLYGSIVTEIRNEQYKWPSYNSKEKKKSVSNTANKEEVQQKARESVQPIVEQSISPSPVTEEKDKVFTTEFYLIEYKEKDDDSGEVFHYSKIYNSPHYGFFIYHGVGTFGWQPVAVIPKKADDLTFTLFLSNLEKRGLSYAEIQAQFTSNISPDNLWRDDDNLDRILERIDPDKGVFKHSGTKATGLGGFTDQELWDELKKRGYTAEDNRLVIVKKEYLN